MYKVLIIDDEPIIRKGLKNIVSWNQYNCEVCGEAADGIDGIEMIKEHNPDIIFTDICMPEMDGLEMVKQMVDTNKYIKIIILTGYCDFAYVKEALVLGAFDYILKPTKLNEIRDVIKRAVKELDEEKTQKELSVQLKEKYQKSLPKLREKLLFEIMMGITTDQEEIENRKKNLSIEFNEYIMLLASAKPKSSNKDDIKYGAIQTFADMLSEDYTVQSIAIDDCNVAFIVCIDKEEEENKIHERCKELQIMMRDSINMDINLSISKKGKGIEDIFLSFSQCKSAIEKGEYKKDNVFELFNEGSACLNSQSDVKLQGLGQLLMDTIPFGSMTMTIDSINNLHAEASKLRNKDSLIKKKLRKIAVNLSKTTKEKNYKPSNDATFDGLFADIRSFAEKATNIAKQSSKEDMKLVTKKAIEYLQQNYQRQVTLSEVANAVYVSPFYISRMFKKETGKTMTEYLNDLRIDNACVLLEDLQYKVYQVGEMVGISDAHYFSRMFKNSLGVTPSEYRNKLKAE